MQEYHFGPVFSFCSFLASKDPGPESRTKKWRGDKTISSLVFVIYFNAKCIYLLNISNNERGSQGWTHGPLTKDQNEICVLFVGFNIPTPSWCHLF